MTRPPPYVIRITSESIHIAELDQASAARLKAAGIDVHCGWLGQASIPLQFAGNAAEAAQAVEALLVALARQGVAFGADRRQAFDPARTMRDLVARGRYAGAVTQMSWLGAGRWCLDPLVISTRAA